MMNILDLALCRPVNKLDSFLLSVAMTVINYLSYSTCLVDLLVTISLLVFQVHVLFMLLLVYVIVLLIIRC